MRLGVLDVGSNTVHLLVVDARPGARPVPAVSHKLDLHLAEHLGPDGTIDPRGAEQLTTFVRECLVVAEDQGVEEVLAFATSALREAPNGPAVLADVRERTGVDLSVLPGGDEARLTFLAVRRWWGWSAGRLLVLDIGGGSLEVAAGLDELPDVSLSLPLGAGRVTRDLLDGDPPSPERIRAARRAVRAHVADVVWEVTRFGAPDLAAGSSKTFRSLARVCGDADVLDRSALTALVPRIGALDAAARTGLPGVSARRAPQLLAGALVAEAALDLFGVERLRISPWALREGVILRRLAALT